MIRKRAAKIKPDVAVGKGQVSDGVISEVDRILEAREIAKIKFLRSSNLPDKDRMIARLVEGTRSVLVETRGNTVTLFRASDA
jgi:putative YhbY family RNA-binding protein